MKRTASILFTVILLLICALPSYANSAEPPCFTVIVKGAPSDDKFGMVVLLGDEDGSGDDIVEFAEAVKVKAGWETYFRFYYHDLPGSSDKLSELSAIVGRTATDYFEFDIPDETFKTYNNLLTLDWETKTVTVGQPAWRVPLLVAMRVCITFIVEFAVLLLLGYRKKRTFAVFAVANLITQTLVNAAITGPLPLGYWGLGFILMEILVFVVEAPIFALGFGEHTKARAVFHAAAANCLSLIVGFLLISYLPV